MTLSNYEQEIFDQIQTWEYELLSYSTNDLIRTYDDWIEDAFLLLPEEVREKFFQRINDWMVYIQVAIQQTDNFEKQVERIVNEARVMDKNIKTINDLRNLSIVQCDHLAEKQKSSHQLYSLIQGGLSGSGSSLFLEVDIPALTLIQLRAVQMIATSYGYDMKNPFEMMISLKVFHCATTPKRFQAKVWQNLVQDISEADNEFFYEGNEQILDENWLNHLLLQIFKGWAILLFRKKKHQNLPLVSMAIGAGVNFTTTKKASELAKRFYQYRHLLEKPDSFKG